MTEEPKADMEGVLAELQFEIDLAIRQGVLPNPYQWEADIKGPDGKIWLAIMTVGQSDD